jgi:hypothetical protein
MNSTMRATRVGRTRRRPKAYGEGRVCATTRCEVKLSRYNRSEHCFAHAPARFPRIRGEFVGERTAKQT